MVADMDLCFPGKELFSEMYTCLVGTGTSFVVLGGVEQRLGLIRGLCDDCY